MSNVLQQINRLTPTKSNIENLIQEYIDDVLEDGKGDPLELRKFAAVLESMAKSIKDSDALREACITEIDKYGQHSGEELALYGVKFCVRETGVKYDYSQCGDQFYKDLCEIRENNAQKIKEREKYLQSIPKEGVTGVDERTGEIYRIYPPSKSSTTSIAVTLPR